ncbi:hypothetical protein HDU84_000474 [Entophlyctis sp. JEL0112]|nr:hypothetical protein HDU84_000474 [Entophlyctis sp. JEL0112]
MRDRILELRNVHSDSGSVDAILEKVESLSEFLQSIRIQTARLKHSIAEFESDNQTHGMWNLESPITESFAFSIITEKIEAIRTDLYSAKKEILGFLDNIYIFGGNYSADECDKTVERLAVFHKKRLAKDLVVCSETFKDVLDGMVARRKNLTNQMSEHSNENFSAPGRIWLSDNQMETNSEEIEKGLYLMIEKRNDLDGEQLREKELKTLEHGMCELVELFEEMRQFVVVRTI